MSDETKPETTIELGGNVLAAAILGVCLVVAAWIFRGGAAAPTPEPAPGPNTDELTQQMRQIIGDPAATTADEYLAGVFLGASEKLPVCATRQDFADYLSELGAFAAAGEKYQINLGPIIEEQFAWYEKAGEFTSHDRERAATTLRLIGMTLDDL